MKSFAFAAALVAAVNAVNVESNGYGYGSAPGAGYGSGSAHGSGYGHRAPAKHAHTVTYPVSHTQSVPANKSAQASKAYGADYQKSSASDWDAWGRDQDLSISESYGKTNAKSYAAESYDEWDNKDDDKWGAQAW